MPTAGQLAGTLGGGGEPGAGAGAGVGTLLGLGAIGPGAGAGDEPPPPQALTHAVIKITAKEGSIFNLIQRLAESGSARSSEDS